MITQKSRRVLFGSLLFLAAGSSVQSQQVPVDPKPGVIEITTTLVEVDAVVTDKRGRAVTDLTAKDFQVLQDGKPQTITAFSHISAGQLPTTNLATLKPLAREDVRRTIALVIDDFGVEYDLESTRMYVGLRRTLTNFIEQKMREGDLVSLFSLTQRQGFEQFTNNRDLLKSLAAGLKIIPRIRLERNASPDDPDNPDDEDARKLEEIDRAEELVTLQDLSLTGLEAIVEGMKGMPGRKSIMLFSFGIRNRQTLSNLIDRANRAGVTFYAIDPRDSEYDPLYSPREQAAGDVRDLALRGSGQPSSSLTVLAKETGGQAWGRQFDKLDDRLGDAIEDQNSYYVLGYNPGAGTFDRRRHKIEVKVLRKDLAVRSSRTDFLGQPDITKPRPSNPAAILTELLVSPFGDSAVRTTLSTFFTAENGKGVLRSAIFIDGRDLQAEQNADGTYQGGADIMAVTVNPKGEFSGHVGRSFRFKLDKAGLDGARQTGFVYNLPHADEKPGPYQIRLAVRDVVSGATGSTSTYVVAPDTKNGDLTTSSLVLSASATEANPHPWSSPAARAFVNGHDIVWAVEIYNAKAGENKDGSQYKLQASIRILRNGEAVRETPFAPWSARTIEGRKDVALRGLLSTGSLEPGEYVLQLLVRDENAKKTRVSTFTDFRIVP